VSKDASRHSAQFWHWRVIWVDANADAQLFGHGNHLLDEVGIVLPELLLAVLAAVGQRPFKHFVCPVTLCRGQVESASRSVTSRRLPLRTPDAVAHVRAGRNEKISFVKITRILFA